VIIVEGMYKGTVGAVESITGKLATIISYTDNMEKTFTVFVRFLKKDTIARQTKIANTNQTYQKDDFIQLLNGKVGIVLWYQRDKVTILTQDGISKSVSFEEIDFKKDNKRVTAQNHSK